jgi:hypothetical protein
VAVRVYPGAANPSHEFSLSDGVQTWGLRLDGGPEAVREAPLTPSTLRFNNGVTGFGDWEPGMAQIEQRDWSGGRGLETFSTEDLESAKRFHDSMNAWTVTPGKVMPVPQWKLATGLRNSVQHLPGDMGWKGLFGEQRFIAGKFTVGAAALAAKRVKVWLRRVGSPGALSLALHLNDGGAPGTAIPQATDSVTISDITDVISQFRSFDISAMSGNLSIATDYHLVLNGAELDNAANHWEIGVEVGAEGYAGAEEDEWEAANFSPYYRVEDAAVTRNFIFFRMGGAYYAVDQRADGTASRLYLNGERGLASGGGATALDDSGMGWATDQWLGAWVRIVKGKGLGQAREILGNGAAQLQVSGWDIQPDNTSEYVIYGSDLWKDISPSINDLIDGVVQDVAVVNEQAFFAQGSAVNVLRVRFNAGVHEFDDDGTNRADLLHGFHHPQHGPQIWRVVLASGEVSRATPTAWTTALTFGTGIKVGESSQAIRELFDLAGQLHIVKADSLWQMADDDRAKRINIGLESIAEDFGTVPWCVMGGQFFFGWRHRLFAYTGSALVELGPGQGSGLPHGRQGEISGLHALGAQQLLASVDAGAGESSLLLWNNGWHELYRAPELGQRVSCLGLQPCQGARSRLWLGVDGDLLSIELPRQTESLLADDELRYQHEAVVVGGTIDMGATRLPKFLKEMSLMSQNLASGVQVILDYQLDGEIGGEQWRSAGAFYSSPLDTLPLNIGQLHAIRPRLRLQTNRATVPPVVQAVVLEGFARTPLKYQWTMRIRLADLQSERSGGVDADPDAFMAWLQQAAREARKIRLRSIWESLDDKYVIVEPPTLLRQFSNSLLSWWGGTATIILREA